MKITCSPKKIPSVASTHTKSVLTRHLHIYLVKLWYAWDVAKSTKGHTSNRSVRISKSFAPIPRSHALRQLRSYRWYVLHIKNKNTARFPKKFADSSRVQEQRNRYLTESTVKSAERHLKNSEVKLRETYFHIPPCIRLRHWSICRSCRRRISCCGCGSRRRSRPSDATDNQQRMYLWIARKLFNENLAF